MIINTITLGLIFAILGIGIFISFKILNYTDLTCEASFTCGAAISAIICSSNINFMVAILLSFIGGCLAGFITAILHTKLHINKVLSGILTLTAFYTINLWITGLDPNIGLERSIQTIFVKNNDIINLIIMLAIVIIIILFMIFFFKTKTGLSVRACGDNEKMINANACDIDKLKIIGLALSNALIALAGSLFMQYERYYDSTFGNGLMVVGVASIIIGESLIRHKHNLPIMLIAIILGSTIYRFIYLFIIEVTSEPTNMKLISAVTIIICILISNLKKGGYKYVEN